MPSNDKRINNHRPRKNTAYAVEYIMIMHDAGMSTREIAENCGVSHMTIARRIREYEQNQKINVTKYY